MKQTITRALISVSDKTGIIDFSRALSELGIELLSTGGTAKLLAEQAIPVIEVSDYTGFPELMDGRIKTLHPKIHGGILGRRGIDDEAMQSHQIQAIDLVVVNLYPFAATIAKPDCSFADAIENIDIGGPTMLRAAAKNHAHVAVVVDVNDYAAILSELADNDKQLSEQTRFNLALKGFAHTAHYDSQIAAYLCQVNGQVFPEQLTLPFSLKQSLRYGENPHQHAAFYQETNPTPGTLAAAKQLQGKELSYNNIADADAALACVKAFSAKPCCVIVKHANPCGVAEADNLLSAYDLAYQTDPTSAFGGIIAFNQELDAITASAIIERQFVEVLIAPTVSAEASTILAAKPNVRVLACGVWTNNIACLDYKRVNGGLLVQDMDIAELHSNQLTVVSRRQPSEQELADMLFAWKVAKYVKSNAIVYGKNSRTIGIGAGQMSRVYSAKIAGIKALDQGLTVQGSAMASDAFLPFRDGVDAAAEVGVSAIIHPGGSIRDQEVIDAANEHNIAMVFTGIRHFRH